LSALEYEIKNKICYLKIHNPKPHNCLSSSVLVELSTFLMEKSVNPDFEVLIIYQTGKVFIAGGDIKEMAAMNAQQAKEYSALANRTLSLLEYFALPVIVAVNGFAIGGGFELSLCADIIIAAETAQFSLPEATLGLIPGFGGTVRLPERLGIHLVKELLMTGRKLSAQEALEMRIINRITAPEELLNTATEIAEQIQKNSPMAVKAIKRLILKRRDVPQNIACQLESEEFGSCFAHHDAPEGLDAFLNKRPPQWKDTL
jgi:enoyl-CoA hydratase